LRTCYEDISEFTKLGLGEGATTEEITESLLLALKAKDEYTLKHSIRVAKYSATIATKMGLGADDIYKAYLSGLLHDIGKIYVPDTILFKTKSLTDTEFNIIKCHPIQSETICKPIKAFRDILPILRAHHERFDGYGYPDGLVGKNIPLLARIVAVADTLDATTSTRPYQNCMPLTRVQEILKNGAGKQWDADIVRVVLNGFAEGDFQTSFHSKLSFRYASVSYYQRDLLMNTSFAC
jgi:HD-GYP domain-containing protein (c-di-GMP phosphodiesterase class II)